MLTKLTDGIKDIASEFITDSDKLNEFMLKVSNVEIKQVNELNKINARDNSWYIRGARPSLFWVAVLGCLYAYIIIPTLSIFNIIVAYPNESLMGLTMAMLGMYGMRTFEKIKGK